MDMATKQEDCAFAVPPPLFAGRKRRAAAPNTSDSFSFFTAEDFNAFSIRGDVYESRFYGGLERRRWTVLSANSGRKSADTALTKPGQKHLLQRLWEAIEAHHIQPPNNREELENGQRRISSFSVAEHERYLALQRTLVQAQQRGLPGVLALSQDEMKFWKHLENEVKGEQTSFCKMVVRALAAEATSKEAFIPPFVDIWVR
ncbi:hypothetical protein PHYBOEH_005992 [Phytophthora boehmeriae]|uniref:Uncharacterized protein n=1 Tax=Phytophthora boehmeriae TaxID=109152 RepID=A0A8T1WPD7_9STRA|nr:hypothetical protein PHYBOEH_005992 [Phytophthora boehmeriae]